MYSKNIERLAAIALTFMVFAAGYVCGSMGSGVAEAQLQDLGTQALKGAAGGTSVGQMGTTLVEMEQHVSGLQKNLDALKKVKAALGG
jgi:hypothetical protein